VTVPTHRHEVPAPTVPSGADTFRFHATLQEAFAAVAASCPDAPALRFGDATITYRQLARSAEQLAGVLTAAGIGRGARVAVAFNRTPDLVRAIFAVLHLGATYVPIDPAHPVERLTEMLARAEVVAVLTDTGHLARLSRVAPTVFDITTLAERPAGSQKEPAGGVESDLAYVIYTSGTTGTPKGVEIEHRGVLALCRAWDELMGRHAVKGVLQFAAHTFDASVAEIFPTLLTGRTLVIPDRDPSQTEPIELLKRATALGVDKLILPPAYLMMVDPSEIDAVPAVLLVAGERCPPDLVRRWAGRTALYNAYGPTEVTVAATIARCHPDDADDVPIGRPLRHIDAAVLAEGRVVDAGETGELHLGGSSLARGYLGDPGLTRRAFRDVELPGRPAARMYATGDLVRARPDGQLVFVGRSDRQVKIRGHRVELAEVEAAILRVQAASEAVVLKDDAGPGGRLVAFVKATTPLTAAALRTRLRDVLPGVMIPTAVTFVSRWPLTTAGKIDHQALLAGVTSRHAERRQDEDLREAISALWCELLDHDAVNGSANFFDLGGNSMVAMELARKVRDRTGVTITVRDVFDSPTLTDFCDAVLRAEDTAGPSQ
jgi:amino acid adenylation domain-containing protein